MPRVTYAPEAELDLIEIVDFIAYDKPEAARRWLQRIRETCETCETLVMQPEVGECRPEFGVSDCRSFSVGSYVIFFRSAGTGIEIARIVHGGRDMKNL